MLQSTIQVLSDSVVTLGRGARRGSGFVVAPGRALVLSHPLRGERVEVVFTGGRKGEGTLVGVDRRLGVALLGVETADVPAAEFAAEPPQLGTSVFALGDPGSGIRITQGTVSAAPVAVRSRTGRSLALIEHTAPIPHGAGGGPLADHNGRVVGVNVLRGDPGFALAVSAADVQAAIARIVEGREGVRLGVALSSAAASRRLRTAVGLPEHAGLLVRGVEEGGPAASAGVRAGDLIVRLGELDVADIDELLSALDVAAGGEAVAMRVLRGADESVLHVDLSGGGAG
jgi:S1-C subfamily serine protease